MAAARVRVPNWRNVRSLALHRHGQSHVAEPFTVRFLKPELDADQQARTVLRMNEDANENARGRDAATCHLTCEARFATGCTFLLSPIGVRSLDTGGPNSTLLGNLSRTLPKREPRRGNTMSFGQRWRARPRRSALPSQCWQSCGGAKINQSSKCNLGLAALETYRSQARPHTVRR